MACCLEQSASTQLDGVCSALLSTSGRSDRQHHNLTSSHRVPTNLRIFAPNTNDSMFCTSIRRRASVSAIVPTLTSPPPSLRGMLVSLVLHVPTLTRGKSRNSIPTTSRSRSMTPDASCACWCSRPPLREGKRESSISPHSLAVPISPSFSCVRHLLQRACMYSLHCRLNR